MVGARYEQLFTHTVKSTSPSDVNKRLIEFFEKRTVLSGTGTAGGFAVTTEMWRSIFNLVLRDSIFLGRMTVFPMTTGQLEIPALDSEDQTKGLVGGISAQIVGEGETFSEQSPNFRGVMLKTQKWGGAATRPMRASPIPAAGSIPSFRKASNWVFNKASTSRS
jgi:HK97 family phage major capsid protein